MSASLMAPSIGRKVWYWPASHESFVAESRGQASVKHFGDMHQIDANQALDATVIYVHHDRKINVVVRDHTGSHYVREHVQLLQEDDEVPGKDACYTTWMPYQTAQHAKQIAAAAEKPPGPAVDPKSTSEPAA